MPSEEGFGFGEDVEDFLLNLLHWLEFAKNLEKTESFFCVNGMIRIHDGGMSEDQTLEDELGDILEKGMKHARMTEDSLAAEAEIDVTRLKDALDYRYDLCGKEVESLASVLGLNPVGLQIVAEERYPLPSPCGLPFCLHVLAMPYGVGVVNAYIISRCGDSEGILFDSGVSFEALDRVWPASIKKITDMFITHWDADHRGACEAVARRQELSYVYGPCCATLPMKELREGNIVSCGEFSVETLSTPGHAQEHNSYLIGLSDSPGMAKLLIAGDLFFAGSVGGGFHSCDELLKQARRLWSELPAETVVAPGHGPLTTIGTEREFNPFSK